LGGNHPRPSAPSAAKKPGLIAGESSRTGTIAPTFEDRREPPPADDHHEGQGLIPDAISSSHRSAETAGSFHLCRFVPIAGFA
jgi:hypothetical protein